MKPWWDTTFFWLKWKVFELCHWSQWLSFHWDQWGHVWACKDLQTMFLVEVVQVVLIKLNFSKVYRLHYLDVTEFEKPLQVYQPPSSRSLPGFLPRWKAQTFFQIYLFGTVHPLNFPAPRTLRSAALQDPWRISLLPEWGRDWRAPKSCQSNCSWFRRESVSPANPQLLARGLAALAELAGFSAMPWCWAMSLKISGWISTLNWCSFGQTHQEGCSGLSLGDLVLQAVKPCVLILLWSLPALMPLVPKGHEGLMNSSGAANPCPSTHRLQLGGQAEIKQKQQLQLVAAEVLVGICSFRKNVSLFLLC